LLTKGKISIISDVEITKPGGIAEEEGVVVFTVPSLFVGAAG
jgi:hypothetical protein